MRNSIFVQTIVNRINVSKSREEGKLKRAGNEVENRKSKICLEPSIDLDDLRCFRSSQLSYARKNENTGLNGFTGLEMNRDSFSSNLFVQFQSREDPAFHGSIHVESCVYCTRITGVTGRRGLILFETEEAN